MVLYRSQFAVLGLALSLTGMVACGDDKADPSGDGSADGNGDGAADGDDEGTFNGVVVESTNLDMPIGGAKAYLFNVMTGEIDMDSEQTSAGNGAVTFVGRAENTGVFIKGDGTSTQDTWNFPPSRTTEEKFLRVGSTSAATTVPVLTDYETDLEAAPVAGSVLWMNPETELHEFVGCAQVVEDEGVADVRYFDGVLPTDLANRSLEQGTVPPDGAGGNDGEAGKYFIGNVKGGLRTLKVKVGGQEVGSATLYVTPRSEGGTISNGMKSNLMLANVVVQGDANPTPADCE